MPFTELAWSLAHAPQPLGAVDALVSGTAAESYGAVDALTAGRAHLVESIHGGFAPPPRLG
ncbi:MAG: hypothetical protein GX471_03260 [Candidatus Microthrix parvicella]|nr:hypothetical protein [Candidatus Microthrix sp.]MBK6500836.1 hypothetical protein [Candidatus Microthrix sp.]NLH65191.1 hypothetical protein [Candidatus Microthrix parvicella]